MVIVYKMSYIRRKNRAVNKNTFLDNRLTTFTNPPMKIGDLYVEHNETVGGDLDVSGNLRVRGDLSATNFYATGNFYLDNFVLIPYGTIIQSAAINVPGGWLDCNGSIVLRTVYGNLFNAIGYTYGSFSGSDLSFNLPDLRGRVGVGAGQGSGLTARTIGAKSGEENHTLTTSEIPSHSHTGTTDSAGTHTHTSNANGGQGSQADPTYGLLTSNTLNTGTTSDSTSSEPNIFALPVALTINSAGAHTHTFTSATTGGGAGHNNMQPFIVLRYFIKY